MAKVTLEIPFQIKQSISIPPLFTLQSLELMVSLARWNYLEQ